MPKHTRLLSSVTPTRRKPEHTRLLEPAALLDEVMIDMVVVGFIGAMHMDQKCGNAIAVRSGGVKTVLRVGKGLDLPKSWFLGTCEQVKLNCRQH